jgi:hypothetical protein
MKERISHVPGEQPNQSPAAPGDISLIDTLEAPALRKLLKTIYVAAGWVDIALMDKPIVAEAMRLELARIALSPLVAGMNIKADIQSKLAAIDKWLDRTEGKPTQTQVIETKNQMTINYTATDRFLESLGITPDKIIDN